jgi:F-type H+-transporting ATPase subunit b
MLVDWFTVIAQVVNFLVLMWLLKRFLYGPILLAIDAREQRIASELADADTKRTEAEKQRDEFEKKNQAFERQRDMLLKQAADDARAERSRLLDQARQAADILRAKRQEALRVEHQSLCEALSHRAREEVFAIARQALADLAGMTLEERITEVFLGRLRQLDSSQIAKFKSAALRSLLVRTAFTLPAGQRAAIESAVREIVGGKASVQFATAPDLVSGIELSTDGYKVAWSMANYLVSLGMAADELLKQTRAGAKGESKTE